MGEDLGGAEAKGTATEVGHDGLDEGGGRVARRSIGHKEIGQCKDRRQRTGSRVATVGRSRATNEAGTGDEGVHDALLHPP